MLKELFAHPLTRGVDIDAPRCTELRRSVIQNKTFLRQIYINWYKSLVRDCSTIQFQQGADFAISLEHEDDIKGQRNIMFDDMHEYIIQAHVSIRVFHAIAIFLEQPIVSFDSRSHRLEFFVNVSCSIKTKELFNISCCPIKEEKSKETF